MDMVMQRWRGSFALKLIVVLALVALGDLVFFQNRWFEAGFGVFGLGMVLALAIAQPATLRDWRARIALAAAALFSVAIIFDASLLAFVLMVLALPMALLLPRTQGFDDGWRWFQRLFVHGLISLVGPMIDLSRHAKVRRTRKPGSRGVGDILPILVLPVFGTLVFVWLFAIANPVIAEWLNSLAAPDMNGETIVRVILWFVFAGAALWLLRPRAVLKLFGTFDGSGDVAMPGVTPASVLLSLIAFNTLFLLQNGMDAAWLWGLAPLPEDMTLANYAHRGAYPLVVTALLTALFVLVALRPGSTTAANPAIRALVIAWVVQNIFLVFNAALRTWSYVEAYSLTILRISALLWMGLVAVGLVLVLWRMLAGKSSAWLINTNLAAAGLLLSVVCFIDLGAVAANWNVRHGREIDGGGAVTDLCYLNELGDSALLPLLELEQRGIGGRFDARVRNVRSIVYHRARQAAESGIWDIRRLRRLEQAKALLGDAASLDVDRYSVTCDGAALPKEPPPSAYVPQSAEEAVESAAGAGMQSPVAASGEPVVEAQRPLVQPTLTEGRER